jgi:antitoxin component YwqK of YwqJK toxin-antitoxin module
MGELRKSYYPSGAIKEICYFFKDKPEGQHTLYYDSGHIWQITNYVDGNHNGVKRTFMIDSDGNHFCCLSETFFDDKKEGPSIRFYKKNSLMKVENYKNNKPHGTNTEYYPTGIVHTISVYNDGYRESYKEHHPNGVLHRDIRFVNDWIADGTYIEYHDNQHPKKIYNIQKRQKIGDLTEFYPNGQEKTICFYDNNGQLKGEMRTYHDNGHLKSFESYVDGRKDGRCEYFYKSGRYRMIANYNMGISVGEYKRLRPNGDIIGHFRYVAGKRQPVNQ